MHRIEDEYFFFFLLLSIRTTIYTNRCTLSVSRGEKSIKVKRKFSWAHAYRSIALSNSFLTFEMDGNVEQNLKIKKTQHGTNFMRNLLDSNTVPISNTNWRFTWMCIITLLYCNEQFRRKYAVIYYLTRYFCVNFNLILLIFWQK